MKNYLKRTTTFFLALLMLVSVPLQAFAEVGEKKINYDENPISDSGFKEGYINNKDIDVKVAKPTEGSKKFIEGPDIPDIYTMRSEYRIQRGDSKINNYQPYEASVGAGIKEEDKKKIKQTINLPDFDGYTTPTPSFDVTHDSIVNKAKEGEKISKKEGSKIWTEHKGVLPYVYNGKKNTLTVKHIFQSLEDKNKYGPMDGQTKEIETTETGLTGSIVTISPLEKEEIKGYEPETSVIETQMPENTEKYVVEYRYNRKHFDVRYDTKEGTPIPTRTIYYGQRVPSIPLLGKDGKPTTETTADPTYKLGSDFLGWKPSIDLKTQDGKEFTKDEIIKDSSGNPIKNLDAKFIMPADHVTFTAVWKDKEKADYAVQFWTEKADHADNASILDKYEYMSTRVYKQEPTGKRPELDKEPVDGLKFPDLDKTRLKKIWNGEKFNRDHDLYLNKFFVYNKELTDKENADPKQPAMTKSVSATGKTVYNIYYDRQVYDLYFTKSNAQPEKNTIYPEIWKYDEKKGEAVKVGGPGKPYHYKARFNEMMYKWPNDAKQTKGFTPGYQSFGWGPNYTRPNWPLHLDTPPYRLNADEFLDMANYTSWGGYTKHIDKGDGNTIDLDRFDFTTLSFGIKQDKPSIPHHMDFWMDGFKKDETIIRYDLVRTKADTAGLDYGHRYPIVTGFTPYGHNPRSAWPTISEGSEENGRVNEDGIGELNDERYEITPNNSGSYYNNNGIKLTIGQLDFIPVFFSDDDGYGDPIVGGQEFKENGYLQFHYKRNKYPLRFNYDPSKIKDDSEFGPTNQLDTFYEFPLKVLSPDLVDSNLDRDDKEYFKEDPKNLIDNPENLKKLGLTDLVYTDSTDNKLKVKRPDNLPEQMVFKGWALDPAGTKLVWENPKETMPFHPVNLYAKWAEPDFKWKVTLDPNGGALSPIKAEDLTKSKKTIQEGDIGQEEKKTYPEKKPNDGKKQIFTVIQRQQLNELKEPKRWGYDFLGWEWVKFNADGTEDKTYFNDYKVPELYSFGNDVVSDVYLRAIWVKNDLQTVMAYHHILDKDLKEVAGSPESQELPKRRKGHFAAALGSKQGAEYTLVPKAQWEDLKQKNETFNNYYNEETGRTNNYFQVHEIKGPVEEVQEDGTIKEVNNKENDFHFFYMPYRKREYKVNYLDERCKKDVEEFIKNAKAKYKTDYEAIKNDSTKTEDQKRDAYRALVKKNSEKFEKIVSKYSIIEAETVINGKRHYDARNYRHIPGWTLADKESPQQQLFFDVDENTNEFLGINGTGLGEIFFFYQDARVIEVKNPKDPVPDGYVRVTFKIDDKNKGGVFKDKDNNEVTELYYDVIKGLKSDSLPVPGELGTKADGSPNDKEERKYYITPDNGKNFLKWDNKPLLNKETILQTADNDYYVFTAYFDWSGLTSSGLVRTEAFKDPNGTWTNDFAPTLDDLKKQLVWKENNEKKPIPSDVTITFVDGKGNELKTDDDVFNLVKEKKIDDSKETVRIEKIDAIATFKKDQAEVTKLKGELKALAEGLKTLEAADPQDKDAIAEQEKKIEDKKKELGQVLDVSITVYKNRYEALNKEWQKPKYLSDAEQKEAKDGGLKDLLKDTEAKAYVKVTVSPTGDMKAKDNKVYYVNPKAWVEIPEVSADGSSTFINWTADQVGQNDDGKEKGKFDFAKRHKFTKDTVITPVGAGDVVEQEKGKDKPDVPKSYVKVIVKTTDKATDKTAFEKTFWVNPEKEVAITVDNPKGKENQEIELKDGNGKSLGKKKVNYNFNKWQIVKTGEDDTSLTDLQKPTDVNLDKQKYTSKVTVIEAAYKNEIQAEKSVEPLKTTKLDTPEGKEITDEILKGKITPQSGKEIESIEVISKPDGNTVGNEPAKVIVKYKDGSTQGTNDNPVVIPVEVHKNIIPETPDGKKPSDALENYVKVIFTAGEGGKLDKTLTGNFVYYVSPEVEVDLNATANDIGKIPATGYIANGGKWENKDKKELKGTFKDKETVFKYNFFKSKDIVEKTDQNPDKPEGYVTVKFIAGENGEVVGGNKTYFVNPDANIKLVDKDKATQGATNELVVPEAKASDNYGFTGWVEKIDYTNPIKGDREHVAKFTLGQVTLTYEAGEGAKGTAPTAVTVDHGTIIRLANADGLSKDNATFAGWKLDGDDTIYQPGAQIKLEKARTATAQWTNDKNIIPYNPEEPITRPEGYIRVTFAAETGLKLTEQKAYYVKKNAGIKLGNAELVKPGYEAQTGYKFDKWDKEDSLEIKAADIVVTAKATKLDNVIPEKDGEGNPNEKPKGYKVVTFVIKTEDAAKGSITGVSKFYVNPTEYVTINPPATKAETGFEFGAWDKDATIPTVYDKDTTITGSFNGLKDIIPNKNPDGTENKKPEGYKTVTFVIDPATGGKIADGEVSVYYVNPAKEVTVPQPKIAADTGYEFEKWDQDTATAKKYTADTTVKGSFKKLEDIIPSKNEEGKPNAKPDGYVTVTFEKGEHGKLSGQTVYYVNPKAGKTLADITKKPKVSPGTGYKADGWDKKDSQSITGDLTVTAKYKELDDVVPGDQAKPEGYYTVTFVKGEHGKELTGQAVYYVNPNKAVALKDKAPTAVPNTGYKFARWDVSIDQAIQYKDGAKITALYNEPGNISTTEVEGYVKVEFKPGNNGSLTGTTNYWVKPGVEVNVPAPTVKPSVGYEFSKWDKELTQTFTAENTKITAQYKELENIIPQKNTDGSDKPNGYVTVTFKPDANGTLTGTTVYYVKPNVDIDLTDTAKAITKNPNTGYTADGGTWKPAIEKKQYTADAKYEFNFKPLSDVTEKIDENTKKPQGYVTVKLIPTEKAKDTKEKVYFVNSTKEVTISNTPVGTEFTDANGITYKYTFTGWKVTSGTINSWNSGSINGKFIQDTEITARYSTKVDYGKLVPAPVAKKDVVTPKGDTPKPGDLIENKTGLPEGTTFKYTNDGTPDVTNPGKTKAKVEVKYPNGKTVVVEVPITVVDNVVPQVGNDKPPVPDSYVKVTVDTTDAATANTKFTKVFWVKPGVQVTIPNILAPQGKAETDANGVTKTNNFKKWKLVGSNPEKLYETEIKDTFTAKESTIVATYEQDKNVEPKAKDNQWIPQGSNPSAKDFINNLYNDDDSNNKDNLPPGTKLEFVPGTEPKTIEPGTNKTTTIKITYPNGEVKEVPVTYNVTGDVVEQPDPNDPTKKPAVPDNFVKVIVKTTEKATQDVTRLFWVNPEKVVTIQVLDPTGKEVTKPDGTIEYTWEFAGWNNNLTQQFKEKETIIKAKYVVKAPQVVPQPNVKYVITDVDVQPTKDKYLEKITPPAGKEIDKIEIINEPDVSKRGVSFATIKVTYKDGTSVTVRIDVIVQDKNMPPTPEPGYPNEPGYPSYPGRPIPMYPEVRYETIIQEKIVKVPVPVSDNYFKEVRYMQGFNGYFRPNDGLTRAEAAQILANALVEDGYKYNPNFKISYKDIGEAWYTRAVKIVTEANVFAGYDDGNFKPQAKITRNEWIATLKRFQELGDASGNNMNLSDNHWAKGEIQAAFNEGWLKIYTDGLATYKGDEFIPRQEVAAVSNKAFKRIVDKTYIGKNNLSLVTYKDVNTSMWAYEDILCASNTFLDRKDRYIAHWVKEDKNQFNIDTSDLKIVQKNFQRNPR
ncbi:Rib/alpha-like domain-containing protein [Peptoniphilus genitalis]|uniref:Rib/alpha-like domain-containing protein n=1 Tax=Peptoniphilus genitalis TaxID=3036303 RepID=UPI0024AD6754|nr:Rib/alpha-like domain-containing protein [Peptoniphilus sp. Marseille-Q7072]